MHQHPTDDLRCPDPGAREAGDCPAVSWSDGTGDEYQCMSLLSPDNASGCRGPGRRAVALKAFRASGIPGRGARGAPPFAGLIR